ncbi:MAG: MFS transporter [Dehalococcoidia bacterium]|nr:MFS transporter [Dehalococcoidia bacterium]
MSFVFVTIITFFSSLDTTLLLPVMSLYASEIGASVSIAGLVIGLYSITTTPVSVFFGRLIDKVGYKVPLVVGLLGDTIAIFLYSLCANPWQLALVRSWHGISGALIGPATMSAIAALAPVSGRGRSMSWYGMSLAFATLVGFGSSGVIVSRLGYDKLFYLGSGLVAIAFFLGLSLRGGKKASIVPNVSLQTRVKFSSLLKRKPLVAAYASIFAQYFTFGSIVTLLPLRVRGMGLEAFHTGIIMATFAVTFIIVQLPSGAISDRFGRLAPTTAGLVLGMVSLVGLSFAPVFPLMVTAMAFYGIAYGLIFPSVSALVADHTQPGERGTGTGIFHAMLTAGVAIGAPVMGWAGERAGLQNGLRFTPLVMLLALGAVLTAMRKR